MKVFKRLSYVFIVRCTILAFDQINPRQGDKISTILSENSPRGTLSVDVVNIKLGPAT